MRARFTNHFVPGFLALAFGCVMFGQAPSGAGASPWKTLFDGKTTSGWRGFKSDKFPAKGWVVEDGSLHVQKGGGGGDIITADEFAEFDLRFEWKVSPGANSGVMYRVTEEGGATWQSGPEYQVLDDDKHNDGKIASTSAASLYALVSPEKKSLKPVGEFNEGRIVIYKNVIEHWLNGVRVLTAKLGSDEFNQSISKSKFGPMPLFAKAAKGHVALQDHGDDVWYRNIRIRELHSDKEVALFNGKDLTGWTFFLNDNGKMEDVWSVGTDGVLVCKGQPIGYIRTKDDHTNFILRVDWRFSPVTKKAGNSGVLLRQIGADKVWPKSVEAQLQSEQAGDFWNIDDFTMSVDKARTNGRNTRRLTTNERPIGEWNTYEIEVDGGDVELRVNGMVLNRAWDVQEVPGKICLQSEGAEIHFKDIRILEIGK